MRPSLSPPFLVREKQFASKSNSVDLKWGSREILHSVSIMFMPPQPKPPWYLGSSGSGATDSQFSYGFLPTTPSLQWQQKWFICSHCHPGHSSIAPCFSWPFLMLFGRVAGQGVEYQTAGLRNRRQQCGISRTGGSNVWGMATDEALLHK